MSYALSVVIRNSISNRRINSIYCNIRSTQSVIFPNAYVVSMYRNIGSSYWLGFNRERNFCYNHVFVHKGCGVLDCFPFCPKLYGTCCSNLNFGYLVSAVFITVPAKELISRLWSIGERKRLILYVVFRGIIICCTRNIVIGYSIGIYIPLCGKCYITRAALGYFINLGFTNKPTAKCISRLFKRSKGYSITVYRVGRRIAVLSILCVCIRNLVCDYVKLCPKLNVTRRALCDWRNFRRKIFIRIPTVKGISVFLCVCKGNAILYGIAWRIGMCSSVIVIGYVIHNRCKLCTDRHITWNWCVK